MLYLIDQARLWSVVRHEVNRGGWERSSGQLCENNRQYNIILHRVRIRSQEDAKINYSIHAARTLWSVELGQGTAGSSLVVHIRPGTNERRAGSANTFLKHERRPLTTVIHTERVLGVWMVVDWDIHQIDCVTSYPSVHTRASFLRFPTS